MKKKIRKGLYLVLVIFGISFVVYLFMPQPEFPAPPPKSVQSMEDADIESPLRRAYFTDYTREQVIAHYQDQFRFKGLALLLNYPPEDAQTLVRDQTRSTYLQELVHPFRESMYINGFEPRVAKDEIWYKGQHFQQKITIRYVPGNLVIRLIFAGLTLAVMFWMVREYGN